MFDTKAVTFDPTVSLSTHLTVTFDPTVTFSTGHTWCLGDSVLECLRGVL